MRSGAYDDVISQAHYLLWNNMIHIYAYFSGGAL